MFFTKTTKIGKVCYISSYYNEFAEHWALVCYLTHPAIYDFYSVLTKNENKMININIHDTI